MKRYTKASFLWCVVILGLVALVAGSNYAHAVGAGYFQQDTIVQLTAGGGTDYTILGGSDSDSVTVNTTTIAVTISSGETFTLTSASKFKLNNDGGFNTSCNGSVTQVVITSAVSTTVNITPDTNTVLCSTGGGSSGGGGGGGGVVLSTPTPTPTPTVTWTPTPSTTPLPTWTPAPYYQQTVSGNSNGQGSSTSNLGSFIRNLSYGMKGTDVKALQQYLVSQGLLKATPNGTYGPQTRSAVAAWQKKNKLPAVGNFGPQSRALYKKLNP